MQDGFLDWAGSTFWIIIGFWIAFLSILLPFVVFRIKDQMNKLISVAQGMQTQLAAMRKLMQEQQQMTRPGNDPRLSLHGDTKEPGSGPRARFQIDDSRG